MESFFSTYLVGGFVSTHDLARVICQLVTGRDTFWLRTTYLIRNSTAPDQLAHAMDELSQSQDRNDRRLLAELKKQPIDEEALLYAESQTDQWELAIRRAAKDKCWVCADLGSFSPVDPISDSYAVKAIEVIKWLVFDLKYPLFVSEPLEAMLIASIKHHCDASANQEFHEYSQVLIDAPGYEENEVSDSAENQPKKSKKTPPEFATAFGDLIADVEKRAIEQNCEFSITALPGRKIDLQEIANLLDPRLRHTKSTFSDYLKGICKFKKGARETDFYRDLFPELFIK